VKRIPGLLLVVCAAITAHAATLQPGAQLYCHRTANEDMPENTLESLEQAALLGCNVVEIDLRRTLEGKIVLNHDGFLERLTDGVGEAEKSYYGDLQLRDAGSWMGNRFAGMRMALFEDALRQARDLDIRLILDIKTKGIGVEVLEILQREGMLQRVQFNGEWSDVKRLYPAATDAGYQTAWVQPGVTADQVREHHLKGEAVVANFSANEHEMDLAAMKAAVAAGVDAINVDYPRLGADAVGRPVEHKIAALAEKANAGESGARAAAILELSRYNSFPLQENFARWLLDPDDHVSRAAAVALVTARPTTPASAFREALQSEHADARANAAWALGMLDAPASALEPLLRDQVAGVLQAGLLALARTPGEISANKLLPMLSHADPEVRGAAALALASHQPVAALKSVPAQLQREITAEHVLFEEHKKRGSTAFTPEEIAAITTSFRCQMKMIQALSMLKGREADQKIEELAFQPGSDFTQINAAVAAFQLWDRIGSDPQAAVQALGSGDPGVADRAEWILVKAGPAVLPGVRQALASENRAVRERAIQIVAWQGDTGSLEKLRGMRRANAADANLASWAITKIDSFHPEL
jgi:glycerophosphoryl diester phosphodiesterase